LKVLVCTATKLHPIIHNTGNLVSAIKVIKVINDHSLKTWDQVKSH